MWRYARELKFPSPDPRLGHEHVANAHARAAVGGYPHQRLGAARRSRHRCAGPGNASHPHARKLDCARLGGRGRQGRLQPPAKEVRCGRTARRGAQRRHRQLQCGAVRRALPQSSGAVAADRSARPRIRPRRRGAEPGRRKCPAAQQPARRHRLDRDQPRVHQERRSKPGRPLQAGLRARLAGARADEGRVRQARGLCARARYSRHPGDGARHPQSHRLSSGLRA